MPMRARCAGLTYHIEQVRKFVATGIIYSGTHATYLFVTTMWCLFRFLLCAWYTQESTYLKSWLWHNIIWTTCTCHVYSPRLLIMISSCIIRCILYFEYITDLFDFLRFLFYTWVYFMRRFLLSVCIFTLKVVPPVQACSDHDGNAKKNTNKICR